MLRLETIATETLALLARIQSLPEFAQTRLVGGTGLEADPLPRMLLPFDWEAAKSRISAAVREMVCDSAARRVAGGLWYNTENEEARRG